MRASVGKIGYSRIKSWPAQRIQQASQKQTKRLLIALRAARPVSDNDCGIRFSCRSSCEILINWLRWAVRRDSGAESGLQFLSVGGCPQETVDAYRVRLFFCSRHPCPPNDLGTGFRVRDKMQLYARIAHASGNVRAQCVAQLRPEGDDPARVERADRVIALLDVADVHRRTDFGH